MPIYKRNGETLKILVIGNAGSGKDIVCTMLEVNPDYHILSKSSSAHMTYNVWQDVFDGVAGQYKTPRECHNDRGQHRMVWKNYIEAYNHPPDRLAKDILSFYDVYNGMRSLREFKASRHLFDRVVWVDRDVPADISNDLTSSHADYVINNNGTISDLLREVRSMVTHFSDIAG